MIHRAAFIVLSGLAWASISRGAPGNAAGALEQLKLLAGDWEGTAEWTGARTSTYPMNAAYYVTGNGSALVENLVAEGAPVMTSVYHLDGSDLRMTHFCGAQNQPRLKAERIDLAHGVIDFGFVDITNLKTPDAAHVHGMQLHLIDADHISVTFLFQGAGKESRETISLKRVVKPGTQKTGAAAPRALPQLANL